MRAGPGGGGRAGARVEPPPRRGGSAVRRGARLTQVLSSRFVAESFGQNYPEVNAPPTPPRPSRCSRRGRADGRRAALFPRRRLTGRWTVSAWP